jgi:two-component system OmpR family sensor kinase/two-component system sensor histidine kinase QseC
MGDVDLVAIARQAIADAAPLATSRHARVELDAPATLPWRGDAQGLRSLLRNLVDNAVLHGGNAPRVTVRLARDDALARMSVDDNGPGIPAAERERVFDRFHRRAAGDSEGSGLGLAIVRAIAVQHGGKVELLDAPEGGLRAQVTLPASGAT